MEQIRYMDAHVPDLFTKPIKDSRWSREQELVYPCFVYHPRFHVLLTVGRGSFNPYLLLQPI